MENNYLLTKVLFIIWKIFLAIFALFSFIIPKFFVFILGAIRFAYRFFMNGVGQRIWISIKYKLYTHQISPAKAILILTIFVAASTTAFKNVWPSSIPPSEIEKEIVYLSEETIDYESVADKIITKGDLSTNLFKAKGKMDSACAPNKSDSEKEKRTKAYIKRFKGLAISESKKFGIPASIKMAQGILETNSGASELAKKNNNHFGIKCFSRSCAKGHCSNFNDDSHKDFFRKYGSAWESWRAHSNLLSSKYRSCIKKSWRGCAACLKQKGYATAKHYELSLVNLIEKYHLYELDVK